MSVQGKSVIVTGGAKGIGRFIAGTFAAAGARVAVADIDSERLAKTEQELRERDTDVLAMTIDVSNEDDVMRMCEKVVDRWGQLDVLVNNAAIVPHFMWGLPLWSPIRDMDPAFWDRVIGTNLGGTFLCTKHALRHMRPRRSGHIINLYGGGDVNRGGSCAYVVSKDAIRTFTRYVAAEERDAGICIIAMNPGATIATEDAPQEARERMPGPDVVGDRFVLAAEAPLEFSGQLLTVKDGKLAIREDR
jgi:NAD(P)-dependent dehydrogenase (short-subunit alcohol dehydrogenase family)